MPSEPGRPEAPAAAPEEPPAGSEEPAPELRRLHPLSIVRGGQLRELATGLVAALVGIGPVLGPLGALAAGTALLLAVLAWRVLAWQRHGYAATGDTVIEQRGVLGRRERRLAIARVQQVEVNRTLLDRLVGTAEVRLETAGDAGESELTLRVVAEAEARRLRRRLRAGTADTGGGGSDTAAGASDPAAATTPLVEVPLAHVALAAVTGTRLLIVPVLLAGLVGVLGDLQVFDRIVEQVGSWATTLGLLAGIGVAVVVVIVGIATAVVTGVLRDGDFTLVERDGDLHLRRGLLSTRETVIPRTRLQRVTVHRSWIRRVLGYGAVTLHSAGGGGRQDAGAATRQRVTIPLLSEERLEAVAVRLLGTGRAPAVSPHPPAARRRATVRWLLRLLLPVAGLAVGVGLLTVPAGAACLLLLLLAAPLGRREHAHLASGTTDRLAAGRHGALNVTTVLAPRRKIQGTTVAASVFQRRLGLATLQIHLAGPGGGAPLTDLGRSGADRLAAELVQPAPRPARGR